VEDADDFYAILNRAVEDEILPHRKHAERWSQVKARFPYMGHLGKPGKRLIKPVQQAVGAPGALLSNITPDGDQVGFRTGIFADGGHLDGLPPLLPGLVLDRVHIERGGCAARESLLDRHAEGVVCPAF